MTGTSDQASAPRIARGRRIRWRGMVSIAAFFALWHLSVETGLSGFAELPTPMETLRAFFDEYITDSAYWNSWLVSFEPMAGSYSRRPA